MLSIQDDLRYLRALLSVTPWCTNNVIYDDRPYSNGYTPQPNECIFNTGHRTQIDPTLGHDYGWLVYVQDERYGVVAHAVNTRVNSASEGLKQYLDPTPINASVIRLSFIPDPQPLEVWRERKRRMNEQPSDLLHDYLVAVISPTHE